MGQSGVLAGVLATIRKESGVTLTMPMTLGVRKSIKNRLVCQCMKGSICNAR